MQIFFEVVKTDDSSTGSCADENAYVTPPNVFSNSGSTSSSFPASMLSLMMVGVISSILLGSGSSLNALHELFFINHVQISLNSSISTEVFALIVSF